MADHNSIKSNRCPSPSKKVRIIGKIRGLTDKESASLSQDLRPWITVQKMQGNGETSTVFLDNQSTSRRDGYDLDYCYEQDEELGEIYSREIQPLVLEVFDGRNISVIALGARGSGKTYTIQGSQEKPGLAVIAMSEILSKAKELGKSVSVSLFELTQEHVKDLLNPNHHAIQVLEDAQGKVNLKGLSHVPVKCITEFHKIYFAQTTQKKQMNQPTMNQPRNKGLVVHISSEDDKMKPKLSNKINFVDLAGYEDPRKSCRDGIAPVESSNKNNKLLYALLNVVTAINSNEIRVPYRESKLTRILQDSLGGTSHVLLLTCLNPYFCQDSLSFVSLISRSCRSTKQVLTDSTNRSQSGKKMSASLSVKKQINHSLLLPTKKASSTLKGRKLFEEVKTANSKQLRWQSQDTSVKKSEILTNELVVVPFSLEQDPTENSTDCSPKEEPVKEVPQTLPEKFIIDYSSKDVSPHGAPYDLGAIPAANPDAIVPMHFEAADAHDNPLHKKSNGSPPLSEKIREISNNLKALCASTPMTMVPEEVVTPYNSQVDYNNTVEPKTPIMEFSVARYCSPCGTFTNRSAGLKHSLVRETLTFLNSANKEELKNLKGIGDKRAKYILERREESPEPFKSLEDLEDIGLSAKQVKGLMKQVASDLFD